MLQGSAMRGFPMCQARQYFTAACRALTTKEHDVKGAMCNKVQGVVEKLGTNRLEVAALGCVQSLKRFHEVVTFLKEYRERAKTWSRENFVAQFMEAMKIYEEGMKLAQRLAKDFEVLSKVRLLEVRALSGDRRKIALSVRRLTKPLQTGGFFKNCLTWFGERCLGVTATSTSLSPQSNFDKAPLLQDQPADLPACVFPQLWTATKDAPHVAILERVVSIGGLGKYKEQCKSNLLKNGGQLNTVRLPVKKDELSAEAVKLFFPEVFYGADLAGLKTFASLTMWGGQELSFRFGPPQMEFPGFSQTLHALEGNAMVLTWPMSSVQGCGGCIRNVSELFDHQSPSEAATFLNKHSVFFVLEVGMSAWIPMGYYVAIVSLSQTSIILSQLCFSQTLFETLTVNLGEEIAAWNLSLLEQQAKDADFEVASLALEAQVWLKKTARM